MSSFSAKGSPIWMDGLSAFASSESSTEAKAAPAIPSLPVLEPRSTTSCPGLAVIELTISSSRTRPRQKAFTNGFSL